MINLTIYINIILCFLNYPKVNLGIIMKYYYIVNIHNREIVDWEGIY